MKYYDMLVCYYDIYLINVTLNTKLGLNFTETHKVDVASEHRLMSRVDRLIIV